MYHENEEKVYAVLSDLGILYERIEHPAAFTCEEADRYIRNMDGVRTKSLFLCNKKKTAFYLVILDDKKALNIKAFAEQTGEKSVSFASEERLIEHLGLTQGMVSIFGLINNTNHDVKVYIDEPIFDNTHVTFHPNINTATIKVSVTDMIKFIHAMGNPVTRTLL